MSSHTKIEKIENEASDWFILNTTSTPTSLQEKEFQTWLSASPLHADTYQMFAKIWEDLAQVPQESFSGTDTALDKNREYMEAATHDMPTLWQRVSDWLFPKSNYIALASVSLFFISAFIFFSPESDEINSYMTARGEISDLTLEDGSKITLSADSQIDVKMSNDMRDIKLVKGQAFFDVATTQDASGGKMPFEIHSGMMKIKVIGTQFEVHLRNEKAIVSVAEGVVEVSTRGGQPVRLTQGQQVAVIGDNYDRIGEIISEEAATNFSWRAGRLTYRDAFLTEIIEDANRFHTGTITLGHKNLENLRVTTSFRVDQIKEMTLMLEQLLPVKVYEESQDRILILPSRSL